MIRKEREEILENVQGGTEFTGAIVAPEMECDTMIMKDRPMFFAGRNAGHIDTDIIIDFNDVQIDTHNAYKGGIWVCPKDGVYSIELLFSVILQEGVIEIQIRYPRSRHLLQLNDDTSNGIRCISYAKTIKFKEGDTWYVKSNNTDDNEYIYGSSSNYTNLSISYLGA